MHLLTAHLLSLALTTAASPGPGAPQHLSVVYAEQSLDLSWDSVSNACGYNAFTAPRPAAPASERRRVNSTLITSGTHFTYIWDVQGDQRVRNVKGVCHHLSVAAVFCDAAGRQRQGPFSAEVDNEYFRGYERASSATAIRRVLVGRQRCPVLPVPALSVPGDTFIAFMEGPGRRLAGLIADSVDSREVGGCAPISTITVQLLAHWGIGSYKVEGQFIREYHAFVVVNIAGEEYVLDLAADQFLPGVAPVLVPRDSCWITPAGRLGGSGQPAYLVSRVFAADQTSLADSPHSAMYRAIYQAVLDGKYEPAATGAGKVTKKKAPKK